jgi:hypothetical protein
VCFGELRERSRTCRGEDGRAEPSGRPSSRRRPEPIAWNSSSGSGRSGRNVRDLRDRLGPPRLAQYECAHSWARLDAARPRLRTMGNKGADSSSAHVRGVGLRRGDLPGRRRNEWSRSSTRPIELQPTTTLPVICVGWTSQRKKYVPGSRAGTLYVRDAAPGKISPTNSRVDAELSVQMATL